MGWGGRGGRGLIIRLLLHTVEKLSKLPHRKYAPPSLPSELLMRIGLPTPFFSRNYFLCIFPIVVHCWVKSKAVSWYYLVPGVCGDKVFLKWPDDDSRIRSSSKKQWFFFSRGVNQFMTFFPKLISCFWNLRIAVDWSFSTHEVMCQFLSKDNAELRLIPAHIFR